MLLNAARMARCAAFRSASLAPSRRAVAPAQRHVHLAFPCRARAVASLPNDSSPSLSLPSSPPPSPSSSATSSASSSSSSSSSSSTSAPNKNKPAKKKPPPPLPPLVPRGSTPPDNDWGSAAAYLIDKPLGWSSHDACAKLRGALRFRTRDRKIKVGHAGTLDPLATGLLIVCVGKGTKAVDQFVAMEKEYTGTLRLGLSTPSMDLETAGMTGEEEGAEGEEEGEIDNENEDDGSDGGGGERGEEGTTSSSSSPSSSSSSSCSSSSSSSPSSSPSATSLVRAIPFPWDHVTDADLEAAARSLTSPKLLQAPPMFSAVSVGGERLYLAARRGEEVRRPPREISVTRFDVRRRARRLEREGGGGEGGERGGGGEKGGGGENEAPCPDVDFLVACSKGTYVRALAADLGAAAGSAAHLVALRRTKIGDAGVEDAWPLLELIAAVRGQEEG